jgi:hypothetical protein
MEEVQVRKEIPLPRDQEGRPRSSELLRTVRDLVQAARVERGPVGGRRLAEVGLRSRTEQGVVEVVLHFR